MTSEIVFSNAQIVTPDEVLTGSLSVKNGRIDSFDAGTRIYTGSIDCAGDYLMPGMVELHTDNLEKHITPRPAVQWDVAAAVLAHDAQMASAGVTTVYDALSCGDVQQKSPRLDTLAAMADAVSAATRRGDLRAEHRLHLRCEVSTPDLMDLFTPLSQNPLTGIVSLMDHTPGERQFVCEKAYKTYYMGKYGFNEQEMKAFEARQRENSARYAPGHRTRIATDSLQKGFILASHDDATADHVEEALSLGVRFLEFPTTLDAARAARPHNVGIMMGAPNLVRGGSHSGNIAASTLVQEDCLDVLSSDYVPASLIMGVFLLTNDRHGLSLPDATAKVTRIPADIAGLTDRGRIQAGARADLIRVHHDTDRTVVRSTFRLGNRVA